MALYRSLEALYSFRAASRLALKLNLVTDWNELAATLEDELGWWPREEASLVALFQTADKADLERVLNSFDPGIVGPDTNVPSTAAKRVYKLRNSLVHHRPAHQLDNPEPNEWSGLCVGMAGILFNVYDAVNAAQNLDSSATQ